MISLNLISKKKKVQKGRNIYSIVLYGSFGLFTLYFLFQVAYVSINLYLSGQKLSKVKKESADISGQILKDNTKLNNFVLSKFILTEIEKLNRNKFAYKEYLDQIVAMMPAGNEVKTVGFETKGYVTVTVASDDDNSFRSFENNITTYDLKDSDFDTILSNSVFRAADGSYRTDLLYRIKTTQNGGK